jgi:hypothetical protein
MTKIEPSERLTANQCLKHDFFREVLDAQWIAGRLNATRGNGSCTPKIEAKHQSTCKLTSL